MIGIKKYNLNLSILIIATLSSLAFTCFVSSFAKNITKPLLLLLCTNVVFYFLVILSLIQYIVFRDKTYFFYINYILVNVLYITYIIPSHPGSSIVFPVGVSRVLHFFPYILLITSYYFYVKFALHFLVLKKTDAKAYRWLNMIAICYLILLGCTILLPALIESAGVLMIANMVILVICMPLGLVSIGIVFVRRTNKIATILCVGSLFFFTGSVLGFLFSSGIINYPVQIFPFNQWIFYTEIGTALEAIMFFGSFAYRNKIIADHEIKTKYEFQRVRDDIAKDLHDEIGSTLTSINILSNVSQNAMALQPDKAKEMLRQIAEQSKTIQQNMSDIVWSIRPENEKLDDLSVRMREYAAQTLDHLEITTTIKAGDITGNIVLPMQYRRELLLIFKEAINNIAKHAGATSVNVLLQQRQQQITLMISDNGQWKGHNSGTGTHSMKARAFSLGGTVNITFGKEGTNVVAVIPIP